MINWVIGGIIAVAVIFAVRYIIRQHRLGQCAGGCAGCGGGCRPDGIDSDKIIKKIKEKQ